MSMLYLDQSLKAGNKKQPVQIGASLLPNAKPTPNGSSSTNGAIAQPVIPSTTHQAKYRPSPTMRAKSPGTMEGTRKRKHTVKHSRPVHYFEDSDSDESNNDSGDGSSSGDSIPSDAPTHRKRQRTSQITTRSSTRTTALGETLGVNIPIPGDAPFIDPEVATLANAGNAGAEDPIVYPVTPDELVTTDTDGRGTTDTDDFIVTDTDADGPTAADVDDFIAANANDPIVTNTYSPIATNANDPRTANIDVPRTASTNDPPAASAGNPTIIDVGVLTSTKATPRSPSSPASWDDIDEKGIPAFLLRHGSGKREVNIFEYLRGVEDPHFQQVLLHYLHFEMKNKSGKGGSLPTTGRPVEISQWSSRARPANLPNFKPGKRSFAQFIDSALSWWASIQPSWRNFERGKVSREVKGRWDALHATQINGLLNVVILVYWWIRVVKEGKLEDGTRADYIFFAEDVAWVLSNLASGTRN